MLIPGNLITSIQSIENKYSLTTSNMTPPNSETKQMINSYVGGIESKVTGEI